MTRAWGKSLTYRSGRHGGAERARRAGSTRLDRQPPQGLASAPPPGGRGGGAADWLAALDGGKASSRAGSQQARAAGRSGQQRGGRAAGGCSPQQLQLTAVSPGRGPALPPAESDMQGRRGKAGTASSHPHRAFTFRLLPLYAGENSPGDNRAPRYRVFPLPPHSRCYYTALTLINITFKQERGKQNQQGQCWCCSH